MPPIPLIVPIFNRPDYTQPFLENLYQTKHGVEIFPIIVNNGSRKATSNILSKWAQPPWAEGIQQPHLINCDTNKGFAGGVNLALNYLKEQGKLNSRICILHNDTLLTDNWLKEMTEAMDLEEDAGVVLPLTNYANEQSMCISEIRKKFEEVKICNKDRTTPDALAGVITKVYGNLQEFSRSNQEKQEERFKYCPEMSCFCMLVREGIFEKYGFFDEDFWPRGYEDKFWFFNLQMFGWICVLATKAFVHHFGNITSDGPGFCFPDIMRVNEVKFKEKIDEKIKNKNQVQAQ